MSEEEKIFWNRFINIFICCCIFAVLIMIIMTVTIITEFYINKENFISMINNLSKLLYNSLSVTFIFTLVITVVIEFFIKIKNNIICKISRKNRKK